MRLIKNATRFYLVVVLCVIDGLADLVILGVVLGFALLVVGGVIDCGIGRLTHLFVDSVILGFALLLVHRVALQWSKARSGCSGTRAISLSLPVVRTQFRKYFRTFVRRRWRIAKERRRRRGQCQLQH